MTPSRAGKTAVLRLVPMAILAVAAVTAPAQILNKNLVLNGDAESGPAVKQPTAPKVSSIPNWTTTGGFSTGTYGESDFLQPHDFGPADRGKQFFYGGPGAQRSTAVQTVDLSGAAAEIDGGRARYYLSGCLGLIAGSYDTINQTSLKAEFQDASGATLLTSVAQGPDVADVNIPEGLLPRSATGFLPPNVRKAKITIDLFTGSSGYNGYAADNISLVLATDPMFGLNLLVNGNAEAAPESDDGNPVAGWNADTYLAQWKYGEYGMPGKNDSGPADRGAYFLACPSNHSQCRAYQTVDFSAASKLVDAGAVVYSLDGWFGGDSNTPDNADATATFFDATGKAIGSPLRVGPVTQNDRGNQRGVWRVTGGGSVPQGARSARIDLFFHKLSGPQENLGAYADDLVFQLDSMQITTVMNAASSISGAVAPGEFVSLYGSSLGPATPVIAKGLQKGLGNVRVFFNGVEAYLTYVSPGQVNAVVPYGITGKADVRVQYSGLEATYPLALTDAAPGIFTQQFGAGQVWAVNNDGSFNDSSHAVARGGWISIWATGQGLVAPGGVDGETIGAPKSLILPVKLSIGGVDTQVLGALLIYTGEIQVNAMVPSGIAPGNNEIVLTIGNASSRKGVTLAVK